MCKTNKTCDASRLDMPFYNVDEAGCKKECNQNIKCNFFFLTELKTCLMYETCDWKRSTIFEGTTYGKFTCPGRLF